MASTSSKHRRRAIGENEIRDMKSTPERESKRARIDGTMNLYANDVLGELRGPNILIRTLSNVVRNGMTIEEGARRLTALQMMIDARIASLNIADGRIRLLRTEFAADVDNRSIEEDDGRDADDELSDEDDEVEEIERRRGRDYSMDDNSMDDNSMDDNSTPVQARDNGSIEGRLPRVAVVSPMLPPPIVPPPMPILPPTLIPPPPPPPEVIDDDRQLILAYVDNEDVNVVVDEGVVIGLEMIDPREDAAQAAANVEKKIPCRIRECEPRKKCPTNQKRDSHEKCAHGYACRLPSLHFVDFFESNRKERLKQLERDGFFIFEEFRGKAADREEFIDAENRSWRFFVFVGPNREIDDKITEVNLQLREKEFEEIQFVQTDHGNKYIKNASKSKKAMLAFVQG